MNFIKMKKQEIDFNEKEYNNKTHQMEVVIDKLTDLFDNAKDVLKLSTLNLEAAFTDGKEEVLRQFEEDHSDKLNEFIKTENFIKANTDINLSHFQVRLDAMKKDIVQNRIVKYIKITSKTIKIDSKQLREDLTYYLDESKREQYEAIQNLFKAFKRIEDSGLHVETYATWRSVSCLWIPNQHNKYGAINTYDFKAK